MDTQTALQRLGFMNDALTALRYLDTLLDVSLNADGGVLSDPGSGLHCLMKAHLDTLAAGIDLLIYYVKQNPQGQSDGAGMPDDMVILPTYRPGMEHELRARAAATEAADKLRGADLEAVARDTNLAEATVRRVVDRLLAEPRLHPTDMAGNG